MGKTTYVRDFVTMAFAEVGVKIEFKGRVVDEKGIVKTSINPEYSIEIKNQVIAVDPLYFRPTELDLLISYPTKSRTQLGWIPKYDLAGLVKEMMEGDLAYYQKKKMLREAGFLVEN